MVMAKRRSICLFRINRRHYFGSLWCHSTFQIFPSFGRVYAAYGGVFIVLSILWGWGVDKKSPDLYDWIGAVICLIGVSVILWAPRN